MEIILVPVGLACVVAAVAHGYLGHANLIAPATFSHPWSRGMVSMVWQYSTLTWVFVGLFIAASPWMLSGQTRAWAIPLACVPLGYGMIGNLVVSRGRHFGWRIFAAIIIAACLAANI